MRIQNTANSDRSTSHQPCDRIRVPVSCAARGGWTIHVPRATGQQRQPGEASA